MTKHTPKLAVLRNRTWWASRNDVPASFDDWTDYGLGCSNDTNSSDEVFDFCQRYAAIRGFRDGTMPCVGRA